MSDDDPRPSASGWMPPSLAVAAIVVVGAGEAR